jgi:hypothetical protein
MMTAISSVRPFTNKVERIGQRDAASWVSELLTDFDEPSRMNRFVRPPRVRRQSRQRSLQMVAVVAAFFALGLLVNREYLTKERHAAAIAIAPSDDEIYTGSILFMPPEGRICRQILFDNRTWRFSDNGNVDCERAAYQGAGTKHWPAARLRAISDGFH